MEANPQPPAELPAEPSTTALDLPDSPLARHLPRRDLRARFQTTNSLIVLVTLGVILVAVTDVVLQLVVWAVLTAR